ncbi:hypothetical protein [Salipiger sp. PrR002]|uniref:hypothetical protein n=1 Tax=Salipiger sp. PrR002 TaxID=2706489 RepID=UPI0013B923EC|nr:hypothetical protein [Salipiger sp. PrR002]NDW02673.1 hypothetical protein [Salipiger sp. PrR002]NDW59925.1 hypothetical protein [Salipiger sp. PrR004]
MHIVIPAQKSAGKRSAPRIPFRADFSIFPLKASAQIGYAERDAEYWNGAPAAFFSQPFSVQEISA